MNKFKKTFEWVAIVLFMIAAILSIWNTYEREKINRQYKEAVDRFEIVIDEYDQIADWMKNELKQVE